jgi:hypothetical protein
MTDSGRQRIRVLTLKCSLKRRAAMRARPGRGAQGSARCSGGEVVLEEQAGAEVAVGKYHVWLQVEVPGREPYRVGITVPVPQPKARYLLAGAGCEVLVDPNNPERVMIDWDGSVPGAHGRAVRATEPCDRRNVHGASSRIRSHSWSNLTDEEFQAEKTKL